MKVPQAHVDAVDSEDAAMAIFDLTRSSDSGRHKVIAFVLDEEYRGMGLITVVTDTHDPESVVHVAGVMAEVAGLSQGSLVAVATYRPLNDIDQAMADDLRARCVETCAEHGIGLAYFFVK